MDFPEKSFPYQLYKQEKKRNLFVSCGSHDNIYIDDVAKKQFYAQKIPEGFVNKKTSFKSSRPALPLYKEPTSVQLPLTDRVTDPITEERKELVNLITNLKHNRGILKTKQNKRARNFLNYESFSNLKKSLDELDSEDDVPDHAATTFLPKQFHYLVKLHQKYKSITEIQKVNSRYADGCLGYLPSVSSESAGCLISPGDVLHEIKLSYLVYDDKEDVRVADTICINTDDEIYGIAASHNRDKGYVITRHAASCQMFSVGINCNPVFIEKLEVSGAEPTSQIISPYIPNESLVATNKGSVYLWSVGSRKEEVVKQKSQRFSCRDQWRQAIFSSHPRQIVAADCTTVELFDLRKSQPSGMDLFALPSKFLHPKERIRIIKQHSPFVYVVATDYLLIVMDERFPGHPLLQWQHLLRYPPQYLSVLPNLGQEKQSLIAVASQNPMEAYCYLFQGGFHKEFQGTGSPWKLARPDDFTKWDEICNSTDVVAVEQWYNRDSLMGLQCVNYKDGFMAYQLDSHGDIYYQSYLPTNHNGDKTFAAGPGMNDLQLDDLTKQKGKNWVKAVNNALNESDSEKGDNVPISEIMQNFEEIILEKPSHLLCSLCHDLQDTEKEHHREDVGVASETDICHCCRQNLGTGKIIHEGASKDRICSVSAQELESLPNVAALPSDVLSQIVTRLWNEEDVNDLLPLRDEEVKKKIGKRKEDKKKKQEIKTMDDGLPKEIRNLIKPPEKTTEKKFTSNRSSEENLDTDSSEVNSDKGTKDDGLPKEIRNLIEPHQKTREKKFTSNRSSKENLDTDSSEVNLDGHPLSSDSSSSDESSDYERWNMPKPKRAKGSGDGPLGSVDISLNKNVSPQRFSPRLLRLSQKGSGSKELSPSPPLPPLLEAERHKGNRENVKKSIKIKDIESNLTSDTVKNSDNVTRNLDKNVTPQRFSPRLLSLCQKGSGSKESSSSPQMLEPQRPRSNRKNSTNSVITSNTETNLTNDSVNNTDFVTNTTETNLTTDSVNGTDFVTNTVSEDSVAKIVTSSKKHNENSSDLPKDIEKNLATTSGDLLAENLNEPKLLNHDKPVSRLVEDLIHNLPIDSNRQRHSSLSSLSSVRTTFSIESAVSCSLPGFMRTPSRKVNSPMKKKDSIQESDLSSNDLMEEELLSPQSRQSLQMFTSVNNFHSPQPQKKQKVSSGAEFIRPSFSSPKKTKFRKHYVSGF